MRSSPQTALLCAGSLPRHGGRPHLNAVALETTSVAPSCCPAELRPAKAIASIPIATIEPTTAFALSHPSISRGFLRQSLRFPMTALPRELRLVTDEVQAHAFTASKEMLFTPHFCCAPRAFADMKR